MAVRRREPPPPEGSIAARMKQAEKERKQAEKERKQQIRERLIKERQEKPLTEEELELYRQLHTKPKPAVRAPEPAAPAPAPVPTAPAPAPVVEAPAAPRRNFAEERRQLIDQFKDVKSDNAALQIPPEKYLGPGEELIDRRRADEWMRYFYSGTIPDWVRLDADEREALERQLVDVRETVQAKYPDIGDLLSGGLYDANVGAWGNAINELISKTLRTRSTDNWVSIWTMVFLAFYKYHSSPTVEGQVTSVFSVAFLVGITNFFVRNKYTIDEVSKLLQNKNIEGKPNVNMGVLFKIVNLCAKNYLALAAPRSLEKAFFPTSTFNSVLSSWNHAQGRLFVWFYKFLMANIRPDEIPGETPIIEKLKDPRYDDTKFISDVLRYFLRTARSGIKFYLLVNGDFARNLTEPYPPEAPREAPRPAGANAPRAAVAPTAPAQTDKEAEAELQRLLEEAGLI
jgi:hypothetical protein